MFSFRAGPPSEPRSYAETLTLPEECSSFCPRSKPCLIRFEVMNFSFERGLSTGLSGIGATSLRIVESALAVTVAHAEAVMAVGQGNNRRKRALPMGSSVATEHTRQPAAEALSTFSSVRCSCRSSITSNEWAIDCFVPRRFAKHPESNGVQWSDGRAAHDLLSEH